MTSEEKDSRPLFSLAIATVFGVGYIPIAPGTFGSLAGLVLWAILPASAPIQAVVILGLLAAGSIAGTAAERHFHRRDPRHVVLDEVMGMLITLFMNRVAWPGAFLGFLLFRAADVIKPYPADKLEHLPGGLGVMADDGMAAVYANLALRLLLMVHR